MDFGKLIASLALTFSVAFIGSAATLASIPTWYQTLEKPLLSPPNWIFGPVWTILYFLMAVAFYLVWKKEVKDKKAKNSALQLFLVQLGLNLLWSFLFFYFHLLFFALLEIIVLWIAIFYTIYRFRKFSKTAAYLLAPYLLWVSFATYLTLAIWYVNKS